MTDIAVPIGDPGAAHAHELLRRLRRPLSSGNHLRLLQDGPQTFEAIFRAIDGARDHINIESYIVEERGPGEELSRRLLERVRAGVRVNLLFDSFGSLYTRASFFRRLEEAGVSLCEYNPVHRLSAWLTRALHLRDHRKLLIVDGRIGFIGGVNVSSVYQGSGPGRSHDSACPRTSNWRDLHLQVEGPVVRDLQQLFIDHWKRFAPRPMQPAHYFPPLRIAGTQRVGLAACDAGRRANPYYAALLGALQAARHTVLLSTAYLVPPRRLLAALTQAAQRGVRVDLLLPGVSDSWASLHAGRSHFERLLKAGVRVHELHGRLLHAKACVVDGLWATVGSSNADWRSVVHNAEANLVVLDEGFAREVTQALRPDLLAAKPVELAQWGSRALPLRWLEALARRFEFFL